MRDQHYSQIFDRLDDGVIVTDLDGVVSDWNLGAERVFGYSKYEMIGKSLSVLLRPEESAMLTERILEGVVSDGQWTGEITFIRENGDERTCETTMAPLWDENGNQIGSVAINRAISSREIAGRQGGNDTVGKEIKVARLELDKQVELLAAELHSSKQRLKHALFELQLAERRVVQQERLRVAGEMASEISRNLNNMLSPAISLIDLVCQEPGLSERARTWVDAIRTGTADAAELVKSLGALCNSANQNDRFEEVDVKTLILEIPLLTIGKWRDKLLESGRRISIKLELDDVPLVTACSADLRQCLTDLIFNAVDAIPQGGVIRVSLHDNSDSILILVQGEGQGRSAMIRDKCNEPSFTTKNAGSELRLSSCLEIVQKHNGRFIVESELGSGTMFRIELPVSRES